MSHRFFSPVFLILAACVSITNAQFIDLSNQIMNQQIMNKIGQDVVGQTVVSEQVKRETVKNGKKQPLPKATPNKTPTMVFNKLLSFKKSDNSLLAEELIKNQTNNINLQQANSLIKSLWQMYEQSLSEEHTVAGMPYNDVAGTLTYFICINYLHYAGQQHIDVPSVSAVYRQVSQVLLANPQFLKYTDAEKQFIGEMFVVMTGVPALTYQSNYNLRELKASALKNLEVFFGTNAAKMKITSNGVGL